ncbi:MAG TPA: diadenylate cyclase CdaA [Anaerolineaceae bacterium]|nr:diadenylate cyclase CdaA [Anaerolineaceae bacterium]
MQEIINNILFIFQRFNWLSVLDILLVAVFFGLLLYLLRDTEAMTLLKGAIFVIALVALFTSLINLPAFSWLIRTLSPALILAVPVIFAPEIRRALERVGRFGALSLFNRAPKPTEVEQTLRSITAAALQLSERRQGALIVIKRRQFLDQYYKNGVMLDAEVTPQILMQIFYPNTPLHDGAVIVEGNRVKAASCVMPLSNSGVLNALPERSFGLRHRAALGISEVSDAVAVVVSEESGTISIAQGGRLIRRLDGERLLNSLRAFMTMDPREEAKTTGENNPIISSVAPRRSRK